MQYRLKQTGGIILLAITSFLVGPAVPLISKSLTIDGVGSVALSAAMAGVSAVLFFIFGETAAALTTDTRRSIYYQYGTDPTFYWLTLLKAASFFTYYEALSNLPATVLLGAIVLRPTIIYNLRVLYRPKKGLKSSVFTLTVLGAISLYVATFGVSAPTPQGMSETSALGFVWALATLLLTALYAMEKEAAVNKTKGWGESLRFATVHRLGVFLCFLPFLEWDVFILPVTNFYGSGGGLLILGGVASCAWFLGLHTTRMLGAYYASYGQFIKTGVVALGEVVFLGIVLTPYQYAGVAGLLAILLLVTYDLYKPSQLEG